MPELNFNALIPQGPRGVMQGYAQGQEQRNALMQQQQAQQLNEIQLRNALRGEQEALAESEAVKGAASLADLPGLYRKAGLSKQAMAAEAYLAKQRTDQLTQAKTQHDLVKNVANRIFSNPGAAPQLLADFNRQTGIDVSDDLAQIQQLGGDPEKIKQWALGITTEAEKLLPKFHSMSVPGVGVQTGTTDYAGRFTPGQVYREQMSEFQKAQNEISRGQLSVAQGNAATSAGQLKVAQEKLALDKEKGTPLTESQGNATAFGMRMLEANKLLSDLEQRGITSGGRVKGFVEGTLTSLVPFQGERLAAGAGSVMNAAPTFLGGPNQNQQSYAQAKENFITAVLRKESGASISPDEFAREERKYFPQAGEGENIIKQKQRARDLAINAMKIQAGPGAKSIVATPDDPLGLGIGGR